MGESAKYRPRSSYAQPGEIDTSLLDAEFLRSRAAAEPKPNRPNAAPLTEVPESEPPSPPPSAPSTYSHQHLTQAPIAESRPLTPRPSAVQDQDPFYKPLAPAGNVEYKAAPLRPAAESNLNRKSLAPAGLIGSRPAALSLGVDPTINRGNPAPPRGLAPPPGIVPIPSTPLRPVDITARVLERKPVPPATPPRTRPNVTPVISNPKPLNLPALSPAKNPLVRRNVSARFELLPDPKPRWNQLGVSAAGQLLILGFALLIPIFFPSTMQTALKFDVIELMSPVTEIPVVPKAPKPPSAQPPPKPKPRVAPKAPELKPELPELTPLVPQLSPKQPHVFLNLKPVVPKAHVVEEKAVELKPNLQASEIVLSVKGPKAPPEDPKPAGLSGPAPSTVNAALNKVQTGGFGDPNGIGGPGNPNRRGNINQAGSPALPGGPGYGNGTGGTQGVRGTLASDGIGKGAGGGGGAAAAAVSAGVAILYKPNPAYSTEGRQRKIQGDVVIEVIFLASGQMKVTRVVSGLGFGLDDEAIHAAQRIRFTPAMRDGKPVDFPARVRIEFRLVE